MNDLRTVLIEITEKCNAACDHCGSSCDINGKEKLSREDILAAFCDIKEHLGTDAMVNVTGGEPLMRRDLFEIMTEITAMGFDWGMVTNGSLITADTVDRMKAAGMKTITISVDGLPETHETLRHLPGSFEKIKQAVKLLKQADFLEHIQVTFTQNRKNIKEMPALFAELDTWGLDSIRTGSIDPIGRATQHADLLLTAEDLQFAMDFVNDWNRQHSTPVVWNCCHFFGEKLDGRRFVCNAGTHFASILNNGDIFVCPNVPRRPELIQGNIRYDSFSAVWKEGFSFARNRALSKCEKCRFFSECKGDSLHTWDFEEERPNFCYRDMFCKEENDYRKKIRSEYKRLIACEVGPVGGTAVYVEPAARKKIYEYFGMGIKQLPLYEKQVGLVGKRYGDAYAVKYVFSSHMKSLGPFMSVFNSEVVAEAERRTRVIREKYGDDSLEFLGFAHTHPLQIGLRYSVGDEKIHKDMTDKFGHYVGILANPNTGGIGAYEGRDIKQAKLILLKEG